jgi:hypothetical protein
LSQGARPNNKKFGLTSSVVNNDLGFANQSEFGSPTAGDRPPAGMDAEIVDFIVIHKPFVGIETGTKTFYSVNVKVEANLYFRPKMTSSLAYNLFKDNNARVSHTKNDIPRDTTFHPEHGSHKWLGLSHAVKTVLPLISGAISRRSPGFAALLNAGHALMDKPNRAYIRREDALRQIRQLKLLIQDKYETVNFVNTPLTQIVERAEEYLREYSSEVLDFEAYSNLVKQPDSLETQQDTHVRAQHYASPQQDPPFANDTFRTTDSSIDHGSRREF